VTQRTAASAEESASAAEDLTAQAEQMRSYVGDLAAVISGDGGRGPQTPTASDRGGVQRSALQNRKAEGKSARRQITAGRLGATAGKKPVPASKRPMAEQIIPLGEEGFKDF
jgi:methyl-accepting chemotaxis protein